MSEPSQTIDWLAHYRALQTGASVVELGHRTQIVVSGADRSSWLHNLCTNEVRSLNAGSGREAFLTSVQGKTLAHVFIFAQDDGLVIDTVAGHAEKILKHLDHYLISERVTLADESQTRSSLLLTGPKAGAVLRKLTNASLGPERLANAAAMVAGETVWLGRVDITGPSDVLISVRIEHAGTLRQVLCDAGATLASTEAFEAARIENGFPLFGRDITDANLPQEIGRDKLAISFVKGCYLGQETVARIDALGHVNKLLVGLRFTSSAAPMPGEPLAAAGQNVGHVTSGTFSPRLGTGLALGFVRRGFDKLGTRLDGDVEVVRLPLQATSDR